MPSIEVLAKVIIDAFDVDIQLFAGRLLRGLRDKPFGREFATWAENNPLAFEVVLRAFSVAVQATPRNHSLLGVAIRDQLARLPVEVRRAILSDESSSQPADYLLGDPIFGQRYEEALRGLSEQQLRAVANLSPGRLKEWVYSPSPIRAIKLEQWSQEKPVAYKISEVVSAVAPTLKKLDHSFAEILNDLNDKLEERGIIAPEKLTLEQRKRRGWFIRFIEWLGR